MGEREARERARASAPATAAATALAHVVLVAVALVVDAPERQPHRRRADARTCATVLLAPRASRLALRREAAAPVPAPGRRCRARIAAEDGEELDGRSGAGPGGDRRAEREHAVVEVGRDDHDPPPRRLRGWSAATTPYDRGLDGGQHAEPAPLRPAGRPETAPPAARGVRRLAPAAPAGARRPPARDADRPELGVRARHADRPRLRRGIRRRPRGRHPRPRTRDRGPRLHDALRARRRAGRHPHGDRRQPAGDDRR